MEGKAYLVKSDVPVKNVRKLEIAMASLSGVADGRGRA
jgi:hypothetical protein